MGYSLFVGGEENDFPLCSAEWYHRFLEEVAIIGGCPNILRFTPNVSVGLHSKFDKPISEWSKVSIPNMKEEAQRLVAVSYTHLTLPTLSPV